MNSKITALLAAALLAGSCTLAMAQAGGGSGGSGAGGANAAPKAESAPGGPAGQAGGMKTRKVSHKKKKKHHHMAAVEQTIQYKRELLAGDVVTIHSRLEEIRDKSVRFTHEMRKADTDEVAATTTITGVHIDTVARRACGFPERVREKGAALIA